MIEIYTDQTSMPFGKYKGQPLSNVPADYFHWWWHKTDRNNSSLSQYIHKNMTAFEDENPNLIWTK